MSYTAEEGRREILDDLAAATEQLSVALASLSEAYERLSEQQADALEDQLFTPMQTAYGRARRTHSEFAARHGLSSAPPEQGSSGVHDNDPRVYLQRAIQATERADVMIGELQDSMLPVEVGDRELREGLASTRELIGPVPRLAADLLRTIGR